MASIVHIVRVVQNDEVAQEFRALRSGGIASFRRDMEKVAAEVARHLEDGAPLAENLEKSFAEIISYVNANKDHWFKRLCDVEQCMEVLKAGGQIPKWARGDIIRHSQLAAESVAPKEVLWAARTGIPERHIKRIYRDSLEEGLALAGREVDKKMAPFFRALQAVEMHLKKAVKLGFVSGNEETVSAIEEAVAALGEASGRSPKKALALTSDDQVVSKLAELIRDYTDIESQAAKGVGAAKASEKLSAMAVRHIDVLDQLLDKAQARAAKVGDDSKHLILAYNFHRFESGDETQAARLEVRLRTLNKPIIKKVLQDLCSSHVIDKERAAEIMAGLSSEAGAPKKAQKVEPERKAEEPKEEVPQRSAEYVHSVREGLRPYITDVEMLHKFAKSISLEAVEAVPVFLAQAVGETMAKDILCVNRQLFQLYDSDNRKFSRYIDDLVRFNPVIASLIVNDLFDVRDFAGPEALDRFLEREDARSRERAEYKALIDNLTAQGFDAEASMTVMRYGFFHSGGYFVGSKALKEDSVFRNLAGCVANYDMVRNRLRKALRKLVSNDAVNDSVGMSLNVNLASDTAVHKVLHSAVHWVIDHPPSKEKFRLE